MVSDHRGDCGKGYRHFSREPPWDSGSPRMSPHGVGFAGPPPPPAICGSETVHKRGDRRPGTWSEVAPDAFSGLMELHPPKWHRTRPAALPLD